MRRSSLRITMAGVIVLLAAGLAAGRGTKPSAARRAAPAKVTVQVSSFKFEPKVVTVAPGTTVQWVNKGGRHTVEADDGSFKSDTLADGATFEHTFTKPGTYPYYCTFHGEKGGKDMAGKVIVK